MSSTFSQRDEYGSSGGWRGSRQSNRGRGGRDGVPDSRKGHTEESEHWNDSETSYQFSNNSRGDNRNSKFSSGHGKDDWEDGGYSSKGKGFANQNSPEESSQRQDRMYGGGDQRGSRGRGSSFRDRHNSDDFNDNGAGGQDEGRSRNEGGWGNRRGGSSFAKQNDTNVDEFQSGFEKLNVSDRGRGFGRQSRGEGNSFQDRNRSSFGNAGGDFDDDEGDRRPSRGRGGFRGGTRGFRDSRSYGDDNGESRKDEGEGNWGRGGGGFGRRDDNSDSRRGRGGKEGGSGRGFSERGNDEDGGTRGDKGEGDDKPRERYIPPAPADDEATVFGSSLSTGNNFDKYDNIPVKVSGDNVPKPISSFKECLFKELLLDNINKSGYSKPTPVQKHAIPAISSGRDVMGCAQTGSGKTAAFLLPIIQALLQDKTDLIVCEWVEPQAVICSPTRELALQIFNEARKFAYGSILKICVAYGGTVPYHQAATIARGCHILVATPGRLNDFVGRGRIKFSSCRFFVLDEADRMLDMGFLPAIEQMLDHETMTPKGQRQTLMFSATFPDEIQRLASNYLHEYLFLAVGIVGGACSDVEQTFHLVPMFKKKDKLKEILAEAGEKELTLVFVEKQRTADFIAAFLSENNFPTTSIHGARLQSQREEALADFKSGRMPTLVATAVAARGLDIKNVAHVVNFDMPSTVDEYVHRIGRTGRLGNRGKATSFYDPDVDGHLVRDLTRILQQSEQQVPSFFDGANDPASCRGFGGGGGGFRRSQNFGGHDVRGGDNDIYNSGPTVVNAEVEESWS